MRSAALIPVMLCLACYTGQPGLGELAGTTGDEFGSEGGGGQTGDGAGSSPGTSAGDTGTTTTTGTDPTTTSTTTTTTSSTTVSTTTSTTGGGGSGSTGGAGEPADTGEPGGSSSGGGNVIEAEFETVGGIVCFEAENYYEQVNTEQIQAVWYTFRAGQPEPDVQCVTDVECNDDNRPECNEYPSCDGDSIDPAEAIGGAYVEALPDRRRDDSEAGTLSLGVVDTDLAPTLRYRVHFLESGRYYGWAHARGLGPAANGLHLGIDGTWPRNNLIDASGMRFQFPNGWEWTQNRRGGTQHTGVSAGNGVSLRDANMWLDIEAGVHTIELGMREDGLELDKLCLALDPDFQPQGDGPDESTIGN